MNEGGRWGIRARRVSAALQGFPAPMYQDVSGAHKSPMTRAVFTVVWCIPSAVTKWYLPMDGMPKPNEMCSTGAIPSLEGFV
jgi:hypothetical protein